MQESARGTKRKRDGSAPGLTMGAALALVAQDQHAEAQDGASPAPNNGTWQEVDRKTRRKQKKMDQNYPVLTHSASAHLQSFVKLSDIQSLILYILADGTAPQWISVRHHQNFDKMVVLMVPGLDADLFTGAVPLSEVKDASLGEKQEETAHPSLKLAPDDFWPSKLVSQKTPEVLKPLSEIFTHIWPVKAPGEFKRIHSPVSAILSSQIPRTKQEKNMKGPKPPAEGRLWTNKRTPITDYVLSKSELLENSYALHPAHLETDAEKEAERSRRYKAVQSSEDGWVDLLDIHSITEGAAADADIEAGSILQGRNLLVIDCEMVTTTVDRFALARISIIDWDGNLVLDQLVKPADPVKDYLTPYSGITEEMMNTTTTTLSDVQNKLKELITPQTILAGHSLDSDLRALKISYPFIIDTSLLYPHPKGPPQKSSLKWLSQKYLGRDIQKSSSAGHDSIEDALACLDLVKQKCERGNTWGTPDASGESIFKRLARTGRLDPRYAAPPPDAPRRTGALVDRHGATHGFAATAALHLPCATDAEVAAGVVKAANANETLPLGADFVFARLRDLEYARGWSSAPAPDEPLATTVARTVKHIVDIYAGLPPRTGLVVLSGSGPPGDMVAMQKLHATHKAEFLVKKWDELSVRWTDVEEQRLRAGVERARKGVGFITVK